MQTADKLYSAAVERMAEAIEVRRGEADYCAIEDGAFVLDHDRALALAASQAVGLRDLYEALCAAQAALARLQAATPDRKAA